MVTRDELYKLVWCEPMTKVAGQFNVSGSYLARICTLLNVPRPERGYWAKLKYGKAPPQVPLPAPLPGDPLHWSSEGEHVASPKPIMPERRKPGKRVKVVRHQTHGLIQGAKLHFEKSRPIDEGAYLKPYKKLLVDVIASRECIDKALNLANDAFNMLESLGYRVVLASAELHFQREAIDEREGVNKPRDRWQHTGLWCPNRPTVVYVGTVAIGLAILETTENVSLRYLNGKYVRESEHVTPRNRDHTGYSWTTNKDIPSGRLRIVAYSPYGRVSWARHWQETKSASLRDQLGGIIEAIEAAAPDLVVKLDEADREAEVRHQQWLVDEERRRWEEDRRRIEQSIADSRVELGKIIEQWSDVISVERFLAGVEQRAADLAEGEQCHLSVTCLSDWP